MKRRHFLGHLAAGATLSRLPFPVLEPPAARATDRLRVLVLGGTNYVGPHLVQAALDRGHEVTLFNRGYRNPTLFPGLDRLTGNRFRDRGVGLSALAGDREWDVVFDTWPSEPGCVHDAVQLLADRVARYVYISSIAVLGSYREAGLDEGSPTVDGAPHLASFDPELPYPQRKRAAELAVLERFGARATVLRCSSVLGFDAGASQRDYWAVRFISGEPVLVPDDREALFQWTDARDIGRFAVHAAEAGLGGVFHLINPPDPVPFWDYLSAWHSITGGRSRIVAASRQFLEARGVRPWTDLPVYIPMDDPEPGFFQMSARRAHATGFPFRPLADTIADVIRTYATPPAPELAERLPRRRELELIWELDSGDAPG